MPAVQRKFVDGGRFTAGLTVCYEGSEITGGTEWQHLAKGFPVGKRFHSAPVVRLADARPMELGHVIEVGHRWTVFAFAPQNAPEDQSSELWRFLTKLHSDPRSPIVKSKSRGQDPDHLLDVRAIYQQGFRDVEFTDLHPVLRPCKGKYGLIDYEKAFATDGKGTKDIFDLRKIDRKQGVLVLVRPDQYVSQVLPFSESDALFQFLESVWNGRA